MTNPQSEIKILHFNVMKSLSVGIKNQLLAEQESIGGLPANIRWSTTVFSLDDTTFDFMIKAKSKKVSFLSKRVGDYISLKRQAYNWLVENHDKYDVVLVRYFPGDPFLLNAIGKMDNVFTIHHTIEGEEVKGQGGVVGLLHGWFEALVAPYILSRTRGVIGVTNQIQLYEQSRSTLPVPGFTYPNGIDPEITPLVEDNRGDDIRIAFVSSTFSPWHGLDIVLNEFKGHDDNVYLDVVGRVPPNLMHSDPRIKYHGLLNKAELSRVLSKTDIGLVSFGLFRNKMTEGSTLKLREYLALGIPVYGNTPDSALPKGYSYAITEPFSLESVLVAAKHFKKISRLDVRNSALEYIQKSAQMERLCHWIVKILTDD